MNATQRKNLAKLVAEAQLLHSKLEDVMLAIEEISEAEREKCDNMPESLQSSERGERMMEIADDLESKSGEFRSALEDIQSVLETFCDDIY